MSNVAIDVFWVMVVAEATNVHNKPKIIGETLRVKGRNPIESVHYKREVTMAEKKRGRKKHEREKNIERGRLNGGRHLREKTHGKRVVSP